MARRIAVLTFLIVIACGSPAEKTQTRPREPERETIALEFAGVPELKIHASADPASEVVTTRRAGEAVSILARKDGWAEIRLNTGGSGWALETELVKEKGQAISKMSNVQFLERPSPVFNNGGAKGIIMLEAQVDATGRVTSVRTLLNTTRSDSLEAQNREALMRARFAPMMVAGQAKPFEYEYRVEY